MKIALFGYGKMGRMVEQAAARDGMEIVAVIDPVSGSSGSLDNADVCIDFTEPSAVLENVRSAAAAQVSMVVGTTGWYSQLDEVRAIVDPSNIGLVYGSNFSIGVNLMFRITKIAAELFSRFPSHDPFIEEAHHQFKKDAPSGTAISLRRILESEYKRDVPTASTRAGYFPGKHIVGFDSEADTLSIMHTARSRADFVEGALIAAKWIIGKKGVHEFTEIIEERLRSNP